MMQSLKKIALTLIMIFTFGISAEQGFSYSYNAWTTMTGEKTFVFNPLFDSIQSSPAASSNLNPVFLYGFSAKADILIVPTVLTVTQWEEGSQSAKYTGSWIMPRLELGNNNIVALQLKYVHQPTEGLKDSFVISPQYHAIFEKDGVLFSFEANLALNYYTQSSYNMTNISLVAAPVFKAIPGSFHIFCELDPYYNLQGDSSIKGLYMNIIPGVWLGLSGGKFQLVGGVQFTNVIKPSANTAEVGKGFVLGLSYTF